MRGWDGGVQGNGGQDFGEESWGWGVAGKGGVMTPFPTGTNLATSPPRFVHGFMKSYLSGAVVCPTGRIRAIS